MKHSVIKAHRGTQAHAFTAEEGEKLAFERRPTEWPGWIWCVSGSGRAAWVPEAWVRIEGDSCVLTRDYNAHELHIEAGEDVELHFRESGWGWVESQGGECGWIPLNCLEIDQEQAG